MYSYCFEFYNPGKKFYQSEEVKNTSDALLRAGFQVHPVSSHDPHIDFKEKQIIINEQETEMNFYIEKSTSRMELYLFPACDYANGETAHLTMPEDRFRENSKQNALLMLEAANAVWFGINPLFAWGDHELEIGKLIPFLRLDEIRALAWVNFFRNDLVEKLGGLDNVLLRPEKEKSVYRELRYAMVATVSDPSEATSATTAILCSHRYPRALLRSFEIPAVNAIERVE